MADGGREDVLGRKAMAAQRAFEARGMSPSKAMRRALSRTADHLWDLALVSQSVAIETLDQDGVVDAFKPGELIVLLDGPDGTLGLAAFDREVMTGLIEVQTIQQVTQMEVEPDRVLTPTDAAMMAPLIDGTMERMHAFLADHPLAAEIEGFRFGAMLEDARAASLILDAAGYRAFRADIDLALGRRKGTLSIILPEGNAKRGAGSDPTPKGPGPYEELLSRVPARLDAVLTRITMPLGKAGMLKPGDMLPLAPDALDRVEVFAGKSHLVARGKLGQNNGFRAVRLTWPTRADGTGADTGVTAAGLDLPADDAPMALADMGGDQGSDMGGDLPDLPDIDGGGGDLGDFGGDFGGDFDSPAEDAGSDAEELPDLPPIDFAADAADFDMGEFDTGDEPSELPDIGLDADFASAPMDFDLNVD